LLEFAKQIPAMFETISWKVYIHER
jgi:hypothetical protein